MCNKQIETRLVYGFLDAGKTTYIRDCIQNDYFYRYGRTLILCFEEGEEIYDETALEEKNTSVAYYDKTQDVPTFCLRSIEQFQPDRIYVEMNTMMQALRAQFPDCMNVTYATTWIDGTTLPLYFANFRQMINEMVSQSHQVTFWGSVTKQQLEPFNQAFRLMNQKAVYLRQDPMGYHEKAFDLFLPFSLENSEITIKEEDFLPLWLDALEHPEHYEGKTLRFTDPIELRQDESTATFSVGRVVMTCCIADLQFMSFPIEGDLPCGGWISFDALAVIQQDQYRRRKIRLKAYNFQNRPAPASVILTTNGAQ